MASSRGNHRCGSLVGNLELQTMLGELEANMEYIAASLRDNTENKSVQLQRRNGVRTGFAQAPHVAMYNNSWA